MIVRLLALVLITGMVHAGLSFAPERIHNTFPALTTLSFGYLLLAAYLGGTIFKHFGLPRLTGYLTIGMLAGPYVLGLVSTATVADLQIVNGIAIALLALTAGSEMDFRELRPLVRSIFWISVVGVLGTACILFAAVYFGRGFLPFFADFTQNQSIAVAAVLGIVLVAQSPAVVIALRDEMAASGPMSQTVLAVVVLADLLVITLFAIVSSLAGAVFGGSANMIEIARTLMWELFGSMFLGLGIGLIISLYFKYIRGSGPLFIITMCFLMAEIGSRIDLDPLLIGLAAGMLIRNFTRTGEALHQDVEVAGLPVYVVFFSVAGASIHLDVLASVGLVAAAIVLIRGTGLLVGTSIGAHLAGADPTTRRYAGYGLLPQAGLAIALAILFNKAFPEFGEEAAALIFGVIAINEIVAPILFKHAIIKSGESGLDAYAEDESVEPDLAQSG